MSKKSSFWTAEVIVKVRYDVVFDEAVDKEQARKNIIAENYYDIVGEETLETVEVVYLEAQEDD